MRRVIDNSEKLRKQLADGMTLDQALGELRAVGALVFDCIVSVRSLKGCSIEEARELVSSSRAWEDQKDISEEFVRLLWKEEKERKQNF